MNAVEIEEAVSELAGCPFDPNEFPYAFLTAFGNKDTTIKRLRSGQSNNSDIAGGVLQRNNIHIAICEDGMVSKTIAALRESPKTVAAKAKFVLATDGVSLEAEELASGETIAPLYQDFAKHFGFFLPLAGISTVKEIKNNPFDIKATGHLNKLYVELLKDNPDWATEAKRPALNQFIARLIFCFFAEDTGIFQQKQFTQTLEQMSDSQSGNTHEVLRELFRAMDTPTQHEGSPDGRYRRAANIKSWADKFPYVNGGMFAGETECPKFSRIARSYLLAVGRLEWDKINPDIFGSMIQAVADDSERGALGMHYTSVPNILKVLNPLFLDDLREQLETAGDNQRKLRNLRKRLSTIRVFDPACGSGNFLVIAYKEMRAIEHESVLRTRDISTHQVSTRVWQVAPGIDEPKVAKSKVKAVGQFLASDDKVLVCTHATFRFAIEELGVEAFDNRLVAVDEFHHVSSNPDNKLGSQLSEFITRDKVHLVAMTGSYFRGDAEAVLEPDDEAKFDTVTYTYYEQLNGYQYLKSLDIGYFFYTGRYLDAIMTVLDPNYKTIVHIPNVNSRESTKDKHKEVEEIMDALGIWKGADSVTGFHMIQLSDGRTIKVADLVDDDPTKRDKVSTALKDPTQRGNRDHVDIIIALGMAKEGFDWIWCEHALTVGYRSSLTEVIQIIGRATRDAPGKERARFTNLIAEPDAAEALVVDAINDTLKAIAASLLMEQVLAPRFEFTPKNSGAKEGFDYGPNGYSSDNARNVGFNETTGQFHFEIKGLVTPESPEATRICREDLNEVITAFVQDKTALERGIFDRENTLPEELTVARMGKIVRERYPELTEADQEAIRQHAIAALNLTQEAKRLAGGGDDGEPSANTALLDGVRKIAMDVRELDIDLIDRINPFEAAYAVLSKAMDEKTLRQVKAVIEAKKVNLTYEEARELALRALKFKQERGRAPEIIAQDAWEKRLAEGVAALARYRTQAVNG